MDFLNPLMLAGAAAAAVPIVLHLLLRQRPKHMLFPALRFIQARKEANRRRLKLRHLLLLALRAALFALLALALSRPSLKTARGLASQEEPVAAALVFDTSPRMLYHTANQTRLEVAQGLGEWLTRQLPPQSQVAVLESSLRSVVFQVDVPAARQRIDRLETTLAPRPLPEMIEEAARLLRESDKRRKEIYIFTDLTRAAWSSDRAGLAQQLADLSDLGVYVLDVGALDPQNFALSELRLSGQVAPRGSPVRVSAELSRTGPAAACGVELFLQDAEGRRSLRDSQPATEVAAGAARPVEFVLGGLDEGIHQGIVRIVGADGLPIDDERYFTVEVKPAWKALVVAPSPAAESAATFTEALAPERFRRNRQARFECTVVTPDKLVSEKLDPYAVVFLLDPGPLEPLAWQRLAQHVAGGPGLGMFLGRRATRDSYNTPEAAELMPGPLGEQARAPDGTVFFAPDALEHPVLATFKQRQREIAWNAYPVFRYWTLESLAPGANAVAQFSNGAPALVERPLAAGRSLTLLTSVIDPASRDPWSLLLTGLEPWPGFVLVNQMALYLAPTGNAVLNYAPGQTAAVPVSPGLDASAYVLRTPTGELIRGSAERYRPRIEIAATGWPGQYRLRAGGADGLDAGFSVNYPAVQSELARLAPEDLQTYFGETPYQIARDRQALQRNVDRGRVGRELYPLLIVLVALALGLEHFVANRFYREA